MIRRTETVAMTTLLAAMYCNLALGQSTRTTFLRVDIQDYATAGDRVIFTGGTSLAKGWNLIQRFSEDIDIFLDPAAFRLPLGKNACVEAAPQRCRRTSSAHLRAWREPDDRRLRPQ